ncbi:hypothetical protein [Ottowia sp.]|nr:hypothetical protein [Ottowia sp.]
MAATSPAGAGRAGAGCIRDRASTAPMVISPATASSGSRRERAAR